MAIHEISGNATLASGDVCEIQWYAPDGSSGFVMQSGAILFGSGSFSFTIDSTLIDAAGDFYIVFQITPSSGAAQPIEHGPYNLSDFPLE